MDNYEKSNQGYQIIAECDINGSCIVLAENINAPSRYVTWETTSNRKNGYNLGNYYNSLKDAQRDYVKRSNQTLRRTLDSQIYLPTRQKKGQER